MPINFKSSDEIKALLVSKIFEAPSGRALIFEAHEYTLVTGKFNMFIQRNDVVWANLPNKKTYSITKDGANFIFHTFENEIANCINDFIITITGDLGGQCLVTLITTDKKREVFKFSSVK